MASGKISSARADDRFKHPLVGVASRAFGNLDDERRLGGDAAFEKAHRLLGVVDVVRADGEFAVGDLEKLRSGDDHDGISRVGVKSRG